MFLVLILVETPQITVLVIMVNLSKLQITLSVEIVIIDVKPVVEILIIV